MKRNAVTLLETLIVVIIIGILVSIAVPVYTNRIERTRGERAIANIELIVDAIRMYYVKYEEDPFGTPIEQAASLGDINNKLGMDLKDDFFTYITVYFEGDDGVQATRNDGSGRYIKYDIDPTDGNPNDWGTSDWPAAWMPQ